MYDVAGITVCLSSDGARKVSRSRQDSTFKDDGVGRSSDRPGRNRGRTVSAGGRTGCRGSKQPSWHRDPPCTTQDKSPTTPISRLVLAERKKQEQEEEAYDELLTKYFSDELPAERSLKGAGRSKEFDRSRAPAGSSSQSHRQSKGADEIGTTSGLPSKSGQQPTGFTSRRYAEGLARSQSHPGPAQPGRGGVSWGSSRGRGRVHRGPSRCHSLVDELDLQQLIEQKDAAEKALAEAQRKLKHAEEEKKLSEMDCDQMRQVVEVAVSEKSRALEKQSEVSKELDMLRIQLAYLEQMSLAEEENNGDTLEWQVDEDSRAPP